ncbi:MAG TPA: hypothetical protein VII56_08710 [Rhizomicrobium sp.]
MADIDDAPTAIPVIGMIAGLLPAAWWAYIVIFDVDWHRSVRLNGLWIFALAIGCFVAWVVTFMAVATALQKIWAALGGRKR